MSSFTRYAPDEAAMDALGLCLARGARREGVIYLQGDLGSGKTTLVRALLRGFGYQGKVRSPTYTLVEPYPLGGLTVYHLDLYRVGSPGELEWLGVRDLQGEPALLLIEWPEQGAGMLPAADLRVVLSYRAPGRALRFEALSAAGEAMLAACLRQGDSGR
jgi:tRNA threonylcarbamoyladenosine biosynthesis protein TsaE